jgi:hypothetical protein
MLVQDGFLYLIVTGHKLTVWVHGGSPLGHRGAIWTRGGLPWSLPASPWALDAHPGPVEVILGS